VELCRQRKTPDSLSHYSIIKLFVSGPRKISVTEEFHMIKTAPNFKMCYVKGIGALHRFTTQINGLILT
jgi:hypothetical protein